MPTASVASKTALLTAAGVLWMLTASVSAAPFFFSTGDPDGRVATASRLDSLYWLSAAKPIVTPGMPFNPDLPRWIRTANLDPDWLRVGTDIVGGAPPPTFNASFSLVGQIPEPATILLFAVGLAILWWGIKRKP